MANMSHCRFENTLSDLQDCQRALDDDFLESLSESERRAAERLIRVCKEISDDYGDFAQ
jgi:hypothetical protein